MSWTSSLLDSVFIRRNWALWTWFSNSEVSRCQRSNCDEQRRRKKQAKPSNLGVDSDQTQAAKASGNGNQIRCVVSHHHSSGRKKQRCKNPATQAPITKPKRFLVDYQTQVMEIRSDTRFLPVALVEEKNMLESGFDFLVLDLICSSVFRAWKWRVGWYLERKERRTRKKSMFWLNWNQVQRARFPLNKTKSFGLDFHEGKSSLLGSISKPTWIVCLAQLLCNGKSSAIYSIYTPKSTPLDLIC